MQEMQEMQVLSLSWEDPLEKGMATHFHILAWENSHKQRNLAGYTPGGCKVSETTEHSYTVNYS